ncbi:hypothetical protein DHEL01_v203250 [Diaporthe helianthi]|uniref:Uncharacterized protein n=1 Tax=Diaporthe helianthi TaxID=158607 RepID=A0A2P5I784_DIAHE|nr:hypothetical protein DHEL01_v203250 [Diaporthe helianthi]
MAELVGLTLSTSNLFAAGVEVATLEDIHRCRWPRRAATAHVKSFAVETEALAIILRDIETKLLDGKK